jgi:hypothetical protein
MVANRQLTGAGTNVCAEDMKSIARTIVDALPKGKTILGRDVCGFGVRRQRVDRVYILKYRHRDGRLQLLTIGGPAPGDWTPTTARDQDKAAPTVAAFYDRFIAEHASPRTKPGTLYEYERRLRGQVVSTLGALKLRDIPSPVVARRTYTPRWRRVPQRPTGWSTCCRRC